MTKLFKIVLMVTILIYAYQLNKQGLHNGYIRGCADVMTGLYERSGVTNIDLKSLNEFCEDKFKESK